MIRHLVFDFDGTLVPSNALKRDAFFACVNHVEGAAALIRSMLLVDPTRDRYTVFSELAERFPACGDADALTLEYATICHERIVDMLKEGGPDELFRMLRSIGLGLHLSSGTPRDALNSIIRDAGWRSLVDSVHGAPTSKAQTLQVLMTQHRLVPRQLAVIGDGASDEAAAAHAGCRFLRVADDASDFYQRDAADAFAFLVTQLGLDRCETTV